MMSGTFTVLWPLKMFYTFRQQSRRVYLIYRFWLPLWYLQTLLWFSSVHPSVSTFNPLLLCNQYNLPLNVQNISHSSVIYSILHLLFYFLLYMIFWGLPYQAKDFVISIILLYEKVTSIHLLSATPLKSVNEFQPTLQRFFSK